MSENKKKNNYGAIMLILILGILIVFPNTDTVGGSQKGEVTATCINQYAIGENSTGGFTCNSINVPCTYFLTSISGLISAFLCNGNILRYTSTLNGNASGVINATLKSSQCSISCYLYFNAGIFPLNTTVQPSNNNILFEGSGLGTIFTVTPSFNNVGFYIVGSNWVLTNFEFNATNIIRGLSLANVVLFGNNDTIKNTFQLNGDHPQIFSFGHNNVIENNIVTNSTDDGIALSGFYNRATFDIIQNNLIYKTTNHNCISVVSPTIGAIINANTCRYSGSNGIALENLNYSGGIPNIGTIISNNVVYASASDAITSYTPQGTTRDSAQNFTISNNYVNMLKNSGAGIAIKSGKFFTINNNIVQNTNGQSGIKLEVASSINNVEINNNLVSNTSVAGIELQNTPTFSNILISGNIISSTTSFGILTYTASNLVITNNIITNTSTGIYLRGDSNCIITGNSIALGKTSGTGIRLDSSTIGESNCVISSNSLKGGSSATGILFVARSNNTIISNNIFDTWQTGITEVAGSARNQYLGNNFQNAVTTPLSLKNNLTLIINNQNYNPFGVRTNFLFTGGSSSGDGNFISPIGTSSTLTASTTYTISNSPVLILVQAIGLSTISINGGLSITPTIGETYYLYPGQTINFGAFGITPPTLQVIFS